MNHPGTLHPLGAWLGDGGAGFGVAAPRATRVELVLFDDPAAPTPSRVVEFEPGEDGHWHAFIPGVGAGQTYGLRAHGPHDPAKGLRFDAQKLLLDPYAKAIKVPATYDRHAAARPGDNTATAMRSLVVDTDGYDWADDRAPRHAWQNTVIYEMHIGGFTKHPRSGVSKGRRGTFAGLVEKIPYLVDLGVTAVELMPVFQFDLQDAPGKRRNYWGYSPVGFFAPHAAYAPGTDPLTAVTAFRDMVKALHRADIEVILDVVYNHTAEGNPHGPTLSLRGLDDGSYYLQDGDRGRYLDVTGTGNTLNVNHPLVQRLVLDSLRYWVREMRVDGFRFDLAAVLSRGSSGAVLNDPPLVRAIEADPVLAGTRLIAEPWDASGLEQVGSFGGPRWQEWNGRFRDDVRCFLRGDPESAPPLKHRILGSDDLYGADDRGPGTSVNFVTAHDGFTLNDLVSYEKKHNRANGERNRDGWNDNLSWNGGVEGETDDEGVEDLRVRRIRSLLVFTFMSIGTPMLLMGDEVRRTQKGNNNPYCQDNKVSWFDWSLLERHAGIHRFTKRMIALRRHLMGTPPPRATLEAVVAADRVTWHDGKPEPADETGAGRALAFTTHPPGQHRFFHVLANGAHEARLFDLPVVPGGWQRVLDTALRAPDDIADGFAGPQIAGDAYHVAAHAVVILTGIEAEAGAE